MNSSLSIPTDNPYKLMAIVGAVIFVFSFYFLMTQNYKYNQIVFEAAEKISLIHAADLSEKVMEERAAIENRKVDIVVKDRKFLPYLCAVISCFGLVLFFFGFNRWLTKIYPAEEEIRSEQLKSIRLANKKASRVPLNKRT